jgi:adenosylhomocysteine nucleosidase
MDMPHKPVAVVAAMSRELAPLLKGLRTQKLDGIEFFDLPSAVVTVGGVGRSAAGRASEAVIARNSPDLLVSAGVAGALNSQLRVGDVVNGREVVDADSGERFAAIGAEGTIATVSAVSGPSEKLALAERWNANVVEMEAAAVARGARKHGIEFAVLKAISDELDFVMPPVGEFVSSDGKFQTARFALYLTLHPKWWSGVRDLNANAKVASLKLCEALQHLIDQRSGTAAIRQIEG